MASEVRGLLLCAGRASRFGGDKLLAQWHGRPLVSASAANLVKGAGGAIAVIPPGRLELRRVLVAEGCEVLETRECERGIGASLAAGVAHVPGADGWIVALGDMPRISPITIAVVRKALEGGASIAAPVSVGTQRRGHPVGFSRALKSELIALDGDEGARSVVERHRGEVTLVPVDDDGIYLDVDTPLDLERSLRR